MSYVWQETRDYEEAWVSAFLVIEGLKSTKFVHEQWTYRYFRYCSFVGSLRDGLEEAEFVCLVGIV